jgi:hypothetical protein
MAVSEQFSPFHLILFGYGYRHAIILQYQFQKVKTCTMKKSKSILAGTMIAGALALNSNLSNAQSESSDKVASAETIRPFHVNVPEKKLVETCLFFD